MALLIPSLDRIQKQDAKLGEALKKIQDYTNTNLTPAAGNKITPPTFVNPSNQPG